MFDFIPTLRTDRRREIAHYQNKGYDSIDKAKYEFIEKISLEVNNDVLLYEVRADVHEVRFFITNSSSSLYLYIADIYVLLDKINKTDNEIDIIQLLNNYMYSEKNTKFMYRGIDYYIRKIPDSIIEKSIAIENTNLSVKYVEIFTLFCLVQEKSNYFFGLNDDKKVYKDGLIRLFISMLEKKHLDILEYLGWKYLSSEDRFEKSKIEKPNDRQQHMYYLTEEDVRVII